MVLGRVGCIHRQNLDIECNLFFKLILIFKPFYYGKSVISCNIRVLGGFVVVLKLS